LRSDEHRPKFEGLAATMENVLIRNVKKRLERLEQGEDLGPLDRITIPVFDSILDGSISAQMYKRCLPAIQRIFGNEDPGIMRQLRPIDNVLRLDLTDPLRTHNPAAPSAVD
jgi:hypothetical protein